MTFDKARGSEKGNSDDSESHGEDRFSMAARRRSPMFNIIKTK